MSNTFVYDNSFIAEGAEAGSMFLSSKLGLSARVSRDVEGGFALKVGDTVNVKIRTPLAEAGEYAGTVTSSDITEIKMPIVLTNHVYKSATITPAQKTLEIQDFSKDVIFPLVDSVMQRIDTITKGAMNAGVGSVVGTAGNSPSTLAHLIAGVKQMKINKIPEGLGYYCAITPTVWGSFAALAQFTSMDYGNTRPEDFRAGKLNGVAGLREIFDTNKLGTFDSGDVAGTVLTNSPVAGSYSLPIDALTEATGTIYAGTRVTVADDTSATVYRVQKNATIAGNATTLTVYPALDATVADGKGVTFATEITENFIFAKQAIATAVIAPAPMQTASQILNQDGMSMRLSVINSGLSEQFVVDAFVGSKTVQTAGMIAVQS